MKTRALAISPGPGYLHKRMQAATKRKPAQLWFPSPTKAHPPRHTFIRPTLKRKEDEDLEPKDFMHGSTLEGTPEERLSFLRYRMGVECYINESTTMFTCGNSDRATRDSGFMGLPDYFIQGSVEIVVACNPWDILSHYVLCTSYFCALHCICCILHLQCVWLFCLGSLWLLFACAFHICICCGVRKRTFGTVPRSFWVRTIAVSSDDRARSEACFGTCAIQTLAAPAPSLLPWLGRKSV